MNERTFLVAGSTAVLSAPPPSDDGEALGGVLLTGPIAWIGLSCLWSGSGKGQFDVQLVRPHQGKEENSLEDEGGGGGERGTKKEGRVIAQCRAVFGDSPPRRMPRQES